MSERAAGGIDLDEELFSQPQSAAPVTAGSPHLRREWPTLPVPAATGPGPLERKIAEQAAELTLRTAQFADLHGLFRQQTAELGAARADIFRLEENVATLRDSAVQQATQSLDRTRSLDTLDRENGALRAKLDEALGHVADLAHQVLTSDAAFRTRETVLASAFADIELLRAKLAAQAVETDRLTAVLDNASRHYQGEIEQQAATIEAQARQLETLHLDQNLQFKTREKLASRCEELEGAQTRLASQAQHAIFLETVLRVEREAAEAKINALTEELARERAERAAADYASVSLRLEVATLLQRLTNRRQQATAPAVDRDAPSQAA